ncbi:isochorismatase family protein [Mangrovibacterium diazotrophicum]|uniref:Nicotinamidase-related amidase n=1 Tax=Mangrovibacterium diazotrophicum TaxID=1261403 RepID=A0A419VX30_9BACT|nr:isochorismatase family protein [Mangrovibacterium diazotrophicum]RKD87739.1 nicotinamidase-related amidase [Mangrovibacterium diazotrophicum]
MITKIDEKTALVLIDLQKGIAKDTVHPVADVIRNAVKLIDAFRKRSLPVVLVTVNPSGARFLKCRIEGGKSISPTGEMALPEDFADLVPEIEPLASDIQIRKRTWNAFFETDLHEQLQKHGVTGIVLGGISTSIGVEGTARAASEFGYNQTFVVDAMSDKILEAHDCTVNYIFPRLGELGTTAEVIQHLEL